MAYPHDTWTFQEARGALSLALPKFLKQEFINNTTSLSPTLRAMDVRGGVLTEAQGGWPFKVPINYNMEGMLRVTDSRGNIMTPSGAGTFQYVNSEGVDTNFGSASEAAVPLNDEFVTAAQYSAVEYLVRLAIPYKQMRSVLNKAALSRYTEGLVESKVRTVSADINRKLWNKHADNAPDTSGGQTRLSSIPFYVNAPLFTRGSSGDDQLFDPTLNPAAADPADRAYYYRVGGTAVTSQTIGNITRTKSASSFFNVQYADATDGTTNIGWGIVNNVYGGRTSTTSSTVITSQLLSEVYTNIASGCESEPNLIVTTPRLKTALDDYAIGALRYFSKGGEGVNIGMVATAFNNAALVTDALCPAGCIYFINTNNLYLIIDSKDFEPEEMATTVTPSQGFVGYIYLQLIMDNARTHGFMMGMTP